MIKALDLRRGTAVRYRDALWTVVESQHVAKGNKRSLMQVKLKNLATGTTIDERFRVSDTLEDVYVDKRQMEYSYTTGDSHFCMDTQSYEQVPITLGVIGDGVRYPPIHQGSHRHQSEQSRKARNRHHRPGPTLR